MATKKEDKFSNVDVIREGDKIVLPKEMSYDQAIKWMHRRKEEEETQVAINEEVHAFPMDGAVAFARALKRKYGWTNMVPTPTFWGPRPPVMIGVEVGHNQTIQVPWGRCEIPGIEGYVETGFGEKDGRPIFVLRGVVLRKHERTVHEIADLIREEVRTGSIYRGKAIKMKFRDGDGNRMEEFDPGFAPSFVDLDRVQEGELVFTRSTQDQIQTSLYNPVEQTEHCRRFGIPLKRGVLLEGPYGTGKTLTAYVLGRKCEDNGWTFIYLDDVRDLDLAMGFAKFYEPAVIFAEDVDRAVSGERNAQVDKILNTLDGVDSKDHEIIVVLTTNHVENIHPAFIRPGRVDAVISIKPPDTEATVRLIRLYGRDLVVDSDEALSEVVKPVVGNNAAVIREVVERSKLSAIGHMAPGDERIAIRAQDVEVAVTTMATHLELLKPKSGDDSPGAGEAFIEEIATRVTDNRNGAKKKPVAAR